MKKPLKITFVLFLVLVLFISGCIIRTNKEDIAGEIVKETSSTEEVKEVVEETVEEEPEVDLSRVDQAIEELNSETKDFNKRCWGAEVTTGISVEETDWRSLTDVYRGLLDDQSIELKCSNIDHCYDYVVNLAKKLNPGLTDEDFASVEKNKENIFRCERFKPDKITKEL